MYVIAFSEMFAGEPIKVKLNPRTVLRFYREDEFDGEANDVMTEYRLSECGTAVLRRIDAFTHTAHDGIREVHHLQFCTIEDFNEVDGELVPTWTDNHGDYA